MSLRARLLAAATAIVVVAAAALTATVVRQHQLLVQQLDDQLAAAVNTISRTPLGRGASLVDRGPVEAIDSPGDIFVGALVDGEIVPIARPIDDPDLALQPVAALTSALADPPLIADAQPFSVARSDGPSEARVLLAGFGGEVGVIVALPMEHVAEARRQLLLTSLAALAAITLMLGFTWWWIDRLGLRPIARLTEAAEEVAAGRSDRRVRHDGPHTETGRLGAAFNTMLDARDGAEARQRRFVADASHELRTPLTTLRGYTRLYASGGLEDDAAMDDAMRRIRAEADRMGALVDDLLVLASLDEGRPLDRRRLDLSRLLRDVASDAGAVQPDRPVDVDRVADGLAVVADRDLLTQAITTVTSNTLRHTPPEAGMTIVARDLGGRVEIRIDDRGPGIEPEHLERLFERFHRADPSRAAASGGRGLGLSIAKAAVEAHGGSITAASTPGVGMSICIVVPA